MEKKKNPVFSVILLVVLAALGVGLVTGVNGYTAPIIEAKSAGAADEALLAIIPEAEGFNLLYSADAPEESELVDVPETVLSIHEETSGLGYVINLSTTTGFTGDPMDFVIGIDAEGKIFEAKVLTYPDTKDFGQEEYPLTYIGQDSTLANVSLVAGVTYSSKAFREAVNDAFGVLVGNNMMAAGVKSDDQVLTELVATVHGGLVNSEGVEQYTVLEQSDDTVLKAMVSPEDNSVGGAFIVSDGSASWLVITNNALCAAAFDAEGNDVTASVDSALIDKAVAISAENTQSFTEAVTKKLAKGFSEEAEITPVKIEGVFNTVTDAFVITDGEDTFYALAAKPYGYSNIAMTFYYVLDTDGAIVSMTADELILIKEYFTQYTLDEPAYKEGFTGLTADSFNGDQALISGATCSSNAARTATEDVFEAYTILTANGGFAA